MKTLRQLFAVIVLILMITVSSSAGDMHTTVAPPQPASTPVAEGEITTGVNGTMHTGNSDEAIAGDAVVAGALSLLQGVWSLL